MAHWLAVEGVQPLIPENPTASEIKRIVKTAHPHTAGGTAADTGRGGLLLQPGAGGPADVGGVSASGIVQVPLSRHVLSQELQMYYKTVVDAVREGSSSSQTALNGGGGGGGVPLASVLPSALQTAALHSLSSDPGLQQLLPYFTQFVADEVTSSLRNLAALQGTLLNT